MKVYNLKQALENKDQVRELHLNRMNLKAIPEVVFQLKYLTKLNISYNNIRDLPEELIQLKFLEHLVLSNNPFETIPAPLMHLSKLQTLDLSYTSLRKFSIYISTLKQLRELKLAHNELQEIPDDIGQLKFLRRLDVSHNLIQKISREIGRLSILEMINLSFNHLTRLPKSIGRCHSLNEINLNNNRLNKLPESIGNLEQLRKLTVDNNRLKDFPGSIKGCKQLRTISANQNRISDIKSLNALTSLAYLHLNKNQLRTIPATLGNCQRLYHLELANNKLHTLPSIFWTFPQLTKIELSRNQLSQLPRMGKSLKHLLANSNDIKDIGTSLTHSRQINRLELNSNPLENVPAYFDQLKELSHLHFRGNHFAKQLPLALLYLDKLEELKGSLPQLSNSQLIRFIHSCKSIQVADKHRSIFFQALTGDTQAFTTVPLSVVFQGLNFVMPDVQYMARVQLLRNNKPNLSNHPLRSGIHLSVVGKTFFDLHDLTERLARLDITFSAEINKNTTHVLLGYRPVKIEKDLNKTLIYLNERNLNRFLNSAEHRYLVVQKDENQLKSLKDLLLNPKASNIGLAIQLLKGGGVPPSLLTPLLVAWKLTTDRNILKELRTLLELNITEEARRALKYPISLSSNQTQERLESSLTLLTDNTEFDKEQLLKVIASYKS